MTDKNDVSIGLAILLIKGNNVNYKNCSLRLDNENETLSLISRSQTITFHIREFKYRLIKPSRGPKVMISLDFKQETSEQKKLQLKLIFEPPHIPMVDYVVPTLNKWLEDNKNEMKDKPKGRTKPPELTSSKSLMFYDPHKQTSLINKKSCEKVSSRPSSVVSNVNCKSSVHCTPTKVPQTNKRSGEGQQHRAAMEEAMVRNSDAYQKFDSPVNRHKDTKNVSIVHKSAKEPLSVADVKDSNGAKTGRSPTPSGMHASVPDENVPMDYGNLSSKSPKKLIFSPERSNPLKLDFTSELRNRKLANTRNSCYLNATMQALASCSPMVNYCRRLHRILTLEKETLPAVFFEQSKAKLKILYNFLEMIYKLSSRQDVDEDFPDQIETTWLGTVRNSFGAVYKNFDNLDQQDAHEYLITLFGGIDDVMEVIAKAENIHRDFDHETFSSPTFGKSVYFLNPTRVLQLQVETCFRCQQCDHSHSKVEARSDLSLTIENDCSIQDFLSSLGKWSAIERKCEKCEHKVSSTSERVVRFPQCLVVNLKRYEREGCSYKKKKCSIKASFELDATVLEDFAVLETLPELEQSVLTEINENSKNNDDSDLDTVPKANKSSFALKVCGGGTEEIGLEEVEILGEKIHDKTYEFNWIDDIEWNEKIIMDVKLIHDPEKLKKHLQVLRDIPKSEIGDSVIPGRTKGITPDGNCFYRSISWIVTGTQMHHENFRQANYNFMIEKGSMFDDKGTKLENVSRSKNWSEAPELIAMATMLNVFLYSYVPEGWVKYCPRLTDGLKKEEPRGSIYLNNTDLHFEPVISLIESQTTRSSRKRKNTMKKEDDDDEYKPKKEESPNNMSKRQSKRRRVVVQSTVDKYKTSSNDKVKYKLQSVVCHKGVLFSNGHYIAYTLDLYDSNQWLICNDEKVEKVSKETVEREVCSSGYVLFYVRQN